MDRRGRGDERERRNRGRGARAALLAVFALLLAVVVLGAVLEPALPGAPAEGATFTPRLERAPLELGGAALPGGLLTAAEVEAAGGPERVVREENAVLLTEELVAEGRREFYTETFGNEVGFTEVIGVLDGPLNPWTLSRALLGLGGRATDNLRVRLPRDVRVGGRLLEEGTVLDTGLDVPPGWLVPLGMRVRLVDGRVRVGVTCALCHASVDQTTGRIVEGAPNADLDTGLILALATNSAALFRNTGADPDALPAGPDGLPDAERFEEEVDRSLLAWPPGNFDSTIDLVNNPSQIPTSFTFDAWPYGWNGFAAAGWFQGLTTLSNNVHALNSDPTTGVPLSGPLLGLDEETYLALLLRRAANAAFRPRPDERPSAALARVDPTPLGPSLNSTVRMPTYPAGSVFIPDGLVVNSADAPFARELNAIAAWQNTLAPPPVEAPEADLGEGARVFVEAGCAACHAGRTFTSHEVLPQPRIGTQPSRALALGGFKKVLEPPTTYAAGLDLPPGEDAAVLEVPVDEAQRAVLDLAYNVTVPEGGYKVQHLLGLAVSAPYLHDGGVAAGAEAFAPEEGRWAVADGTGLGLAGTLLRGEPVDAAASLRALVDRELRAAVVAANRASEELGRAHATGEGHPFWADAEAGFDRAEQDALVAFLLSLDDAPAVLP